MKTIILGFDSFDPAVFENMAGQNQLKNLSKFVDAKGYSRFEVCSPPQTEVSWTSIATGNFSNLFILRVAARRTIKDRVFARIGQHLELVRVF